MREILFRGRDTDGVWQKGFYCVFNGKSHRIYTGYAETDCGDYYPDYFNVDPETIGQYTGLTDKNGKKIFEGDIVNYDGTVHKVVFETRGESAYFGIEINNIETWGFCLEVPAKLMNVIGNIYDNPELLRSDAK